MKIIVLLVETGDPIKLRAQAGVRKPAGISVVVRFLLPFAIRDERT